MNDDSAPSDQDLPDTTPPARGEHSLAATPDSPATPDGSLRWAQQVSQRNLQLESLLDSGVELAAMPESGAAFAAVLRRARALLGAEVSYLSLNDVEKQRTSIHAVDGVLTQQFRQISMPLGTGLLGLVAASDHPMQTRDYLADRSLVPYPENDRKVGGEDVRAILGAPIRIGNETVGALMVADRRPHLFSPQQVDLLQSLATQTAGFLSANERLGQSRRRIRELEEIADNQAKVLNESRAIAEADRAFVNILISRPPISQLAVELESLLGQRVELVGGLAGALPTNNRQVDRLEQILAASAESGRPVTTRDGPFDVESSVQAVVTDGQRVGGIAVLGEPSAALDTILVRAAETLAGLILLHRSAAERETRNVAELIAYLANPLTPVDSLSARKRLQHFGIDMGSPLVTAVIKAPGQPISHVLREVSRALGGLGIAAIHDDHVCTIVLARSGLPDHLADSLATAGIPAFVGADGPEPLVERLAITHETAHAVCNALIGLGRVSQAATRTSLGVLGLLVGVEDSSLVPRLISELAGGLIEYDAERGTNLTETAEAFLDNDQQLQRTASQLYIHVNTLRQRLNKIDTLLGATWRTPEHSFDIQAVFKIRRMLKNGPSDS